MRINRMGSDEDNEIPYILNIKSVRANYGGDGYAYLISIGGGYIAFPDSKWVTTSAHEHEIKSMILYLAFSLNKFFNHK